MAVRMPNDIRQHLATQACCHSHWSNVWKRWLSQIRPAGQERDDATCQGSWQLPGPTSTRRGRAARHLPRAVGTLQHLKRH